MSSSNSHPAEAFFVLRILTETLVMHQSIPAVPSPPPPLGNPGAFVHVVSLGGGAFAILSRPGGWVFAYPGETPDYLTFSFNIFSK